MLSPILRRLCVSSKASSNGSIDESPIGFKNNETAEISRDNETEEVSRELMSELKEEQSIEIISKATNIFIQKRFYASNRIGCNSLKLLEWKINKK